MAAVREKDEWRYATMKYGGQHVTMAGMRWMLMLSATKWGSPINELCPPITATLELVKGQYYWKMSDAIRVTQTYLSV